MLQTLISKAWLQPGRRFGDCLRGGSEIRRGLRLMLRCPQIFWQPCAGISRNF